MTTVTESDVRRRAARIAARAEIRDIRLLSTSAELVRPAAPDRHLSYDLGVGAQMEHEEGDTHLIVNVTYQLTIQEHNHAPGEDVDEEPPVVARVEFMQAGLFELEMRDGDEPPATDELLAYAQSTGQFALYPFAREYIYDITGRLGLPPLTVGVMQMPVDKDE